MMVNYIFKVFMPIALTTFLFFLICNLQWQSTEARRFNRPVVSELARARRKRRLEVPRSYVFPGTQETEELDGDTL